MGNIKRYLYIYGIFFKQYMKTQMQSKLDFFIGFFAFFLNQVLGIVFLYLIFEQIPNLNGWSYYQLIFIYGFAQIPRGIDHFFTNALWVFTRKTVKEGLYDRYLLRPINPLYQIIVEQCCPDGLGEVIVGLILVIYASIQMNLTISFIWIAAFVISVVFGALIFTSVKIFFASNTFFIMDAYSILFMAHNLSDYVKYPLEIYDKGVRYLLTYIIPFGFTAFIPASALLGEGRLATTILGEVIISMIAFYLVCKYFTFASNHYQSAGN